VCSGKRNLGTLPALFVTVPVVLNFLFLKIPLTVDTANMYINQLKFSAELLQVPKIEQRDKSICIYEEFRCKSL